MTDDLFSDPDDNMEVEPNDLGPAFVEVLTGALAKSLAADFVKPWTDDQEAALQQHIANLLAEVSSRGLTVIRITVTKKSGQRVVRDIDPQLIAQGRILH